jgi:hypothetical protein
MKKCIDSRHIFLYSLPHEFTVSLFVAPPRTSSHPSISPPSNRCMLLAPPVDEDYD